MHRLWLLLVSSVQLTSASAMAVSKIALRGGIATTDMLEQRRDIPGWGAPSWGGRTFSDSPAAVNGWSSSIPWSQGLADSLGSTMNPVAPADRVDGSVRNPSITGAVPHAPFGGVDSGEDEEPPNMQADYVPRNAHPPTFPEDNPDPYDPDNPLIPIGQRQIIAKPDRLRIGGNRVVNEFAPVADNYPLQAPADQMPPGRPYPVAHADKIPVDVARYISQAADRQEVLREAQAVHENFNYVDLNDDGVISMQEFENEVIRRQGKTAEEARRLWDRVRYNSRSALSSPLNEHEFGRLVLDGFDLEITVDREDLISVISAGGLAVDRGFWGSGASCPRGQYATGASLKRQNYSSMGSFDNTGLNAVSLRCDMFQAHPTDITSSQGPDGQWTARVDCPKGQVIYGMRVRSQQLEAGRDNTGINDLEFACRARPADWERTSAEQALKNALAAGAPSDLKFSNGPAEGGWSTHLYCPNVNTAVCGVQVRLMSDQDEGDDMGVTDVRLYCCGTKDNCSGVCRNPDSSACTACRDSLQAVSKFMKLQ